MNLNSLYDFQLGNVTEFQFMQIKKLQTECAINDGYIFPVYTQFLSQRLTSSLPNDMLCWHEKQLIGYGGIFFFKADLPEVVILIDPAYRQQGIASQLLKMVNKNLSALLIRQFLLLNVNSTLSAVIKKRGASYSHAELKMQNIVWNVKPAITALDIKTLDGGEFEKLITLHQRCFTSPEEHNRMRFKINLQGKNYTAYFFYLKDNLIGKLHMRENAEHIYLSDICVLPEFQNKKLGRTLMEIWYQSVGYKTRKPLLLEINEENKSAFYLYQSCGFKVTQRVEFWRFVV